MASGSWQDQGSALLKAYLKKVKAGGGRITVLNAFGDKILDAGSKKDFDWTSIGSLASSIVTAGHTLAKLVGLKTTSTAFGPHIWLHPHNETWLIMGLKCAYKPEYLKPLIKHLRSYGGAQSRAGEALEGLSEESVDEALMKG